MSTKFGFVLGATVCFAAAAGFLNQGYGMLSGWLFLGGMVCAYKAGVAKK